MRKTERKCQRMDGNSWKGGGRVEERRGEVLLSLAGMADLEDVVKIHCEAWRYAYRGIIADDYIEQKNGSRKGKWELILSEEQTKHYLLRKNRTAVGMISLDLPREKAAEGTYEVFGLYILPDFVRMGFGTAAMAFAEERAARLGFCTLSLWVLEPNRQARLFFEHLGFRPDGTVKRSYYDRPIPLIRYTKPVERRTDDEEKASQ